VPRFSAGDTSKSYFSIDLLSIAEYKQQHQYRNMNSSLFQELRSLSQSRFSGCLTIRNCEDDTIGLVNNQTWQLFFYQGNVIGDSDGIHPIKRWQHCLHPEISKFPREIDSILHEISRYDTRSERLMQLLLAKSILNYQNVQDFMSNSILEMLFDIYQQEIWAGANDHNIDVKLTYQTMVADDLPAPAVIIQTRSLLKKLTVIWQDWQTKKLMWYSPQLSPYLSDRLQLQQNLSSDAYLEIIQLIDGQKTLRDIAIELNQDLASLTTSLINDQARLLLEFQYVPSPAFPDSPFAIAPTVTYHHIPDSSNIPIVGALIDNELDLYLMQQVALISDYGYVGLQDPQQAITTFLQYLPKIILLDTAIEQVSCYEICVTLRRLPQFKNTPIILLITNQKLQDTFRGKIAGVTAFLPKPLEAHGVLAIIKQYLSLSL
jgi:two-component system, chemotaxis family, response regulator PixG